MTQQERRNHSRFQAKSGCYIAYVEGTGRVRDLSLEGVFILDEDPLPVGEKVKFMLRQGIGEISLEGVVMRSEPSLGMAIQFTNVSREATRQLKLMIASSGPQSG
jgi:hypothetical protein